MKFELRYIIFMFMAFFIIFNTSIYAQENSEQPTENNENAENKEVNEEPQNKYDKWLKELDSSNTEEVVEAKNKLKNGLPDTLEHVIGGLDSESTFVRLHCVEILVEVQNNRSEVSSAFIKSLEKEHDADVMQKMIQALVDWKTYSSKPELVKLLNHEVPAIRIDAIKALSSFDKKGYLRSFLDILKTETYPDVMAEIYKQIVSEGSEKEQLDMLLFVENKNFTEEKSNVLEPIIDCAAKYKREIGTDVLLSIAQSANDQIIRLSAFKNVLPLLNRDNIGVLVDFLWDENVTIREQAFAKISQVTGKSFAYNPQAELVDRIESIGQWQEWKELDDALYWLGSENIAEAEKAYDKIKGYGVPVVSSLIASYSNANSQAKSYILSLLAEFPIPAATNILQRALNETDPQVKKDAIANILKSWKRTGDKKILVPLQNLFASEKSISLAFRLSEAQDKESMDYITKVLNDSKLVGDAVVYTTPEYFSLLSPHIAAKNATSQKIVDHLLEARNVLSWSVLLSNFEYLTVKDKVALLYDVVESEEQFKLLENAFDKEKDSEVLEAFCKNIEKLKTVNYLPFVCKKLEENSTSSEALVNALKSIATTNNTATLISVHGKTTNLDTKKDLVNIIGKFNNEDSKKFLANLIATGSTEQKLQSLNLYLKLLSAADKKEYLSSQIKEDQDKKVLVELYSQLASSYSKSDFEKLKEAFSKETDTTVRTTLLGILVKVDEEKALPVLMETFSKEDLTLKTTSAQFLCNLKLSDETTKKLVETYQAEKDAQVKAEILLAIGKNSPQEATKLAEEFLATKSTSKMFAVLVKFSPKTAKDKFADTIEKSDSAEKLHILNISKSILGKQHVAALLPFVINDESPDLYKETTSVLEKIMGEQIEAEKLYEWNQKYQKVTSNIQVVLSSEKAEDVEASKKELESHQEMATKELLALFNQEKEQRYKIATFLSSWTDADVYTFYEDLTKNEDASLRNIAYQFLQANAKKSFRKDAPVLYVIEQDTVAKFTLLVFLLQEYPGVYDDKLQKYALTKNSLVKNSLLDILKQKPNSDLYKKLLKNSDEEYQQKLLGILGDHPTTGNLEIIGRSIIERDSKSAQVFLDALKNYTKVPVDSKSSREKFVTWWLNYEKELNKEQKVFESLEKLADNFLLKREARRQLDIENITSDKLLEYFESDSLSAKGKESLLKLLSESPQEKHNDFFIKFATNNDKSIKKYAIKSLAEIGYDKNVNILEKYVGDDDSQIRLFVVASLGESKAETASTFLKDSLNDVNFNVRAEAFYWLMERGELSKEKALEMFAENQPPSIQNMAISYLEKQDEKSIIPKLIFYLDNPFEEIRATAYSALVTLSGQNFEFDSKTDERTDSVNEWNSWWKIYKEEKEITDLIDSFTHEGINSEAVRKRLLGSGSAVQEVLLKKLDDPRGIVREQVILTLKEMNKRSLTLDITRAVKDSDIQVRVEALSALEKITTQKIDLAVNKEAEEKWQAAVKDIFTWWDGKEKSLQEQKQKDAADTKTKIEELLNKLAEENSDKKKITKDIEAFGSSAIAFIEKGLASENPKVIVATLNVLSALKAKQSVPQIIMLLQKEGIRKEVEQTLTELMGSLPIKSVSITEREEKVKAVAMWWQGEQQKAENQAMESIEEILNQTEKNGYSDEALKQLTQLNERKVLEDYLADQRMAVKQTVISALMEFNNKDSVAVLQTYLKGTTFPERKQVVTAIRIISGQEFLPVEPKDEAEWETVYNKVSEWVKTWESEKKKLLANVKSDLEKAADNNKVAEAVKELSKLGKQASNSARALLSSTKESYRIAALELAKNLGSRDDVIAIVHLLNDDSQKVRNLTMETIQKIANVENLPKPTLSNTWTVQIAQLQDHWKVLQEKNINLSHLSNTLVDLAQSEISEDDAKKVLNEKGTGVISAISPLLKDQNDYIRLGAVKALGLVGNFEQGRSVATCLNDRNIDVRQSAYATISTWAKEKPSIELFPSVDQNKEWLQKSDKWLEEWRENEKAAQLEEILNQLKEKSAKVEGLTVIWTSEQADHVQTIVEYLRNSLKEIRDKASDILNDGPAQEALRDELVSYNDEAVSKEEIDENYDEYNSWLDGVRKNIVQKTQEIQSTLASLESEKETITPVSSLEDYDNVRDIIAEMGTDHHPLVLQKYKEILEKYGLDVSVFNPYDSEELRSDQLYKIEAGPLYTKKKQLEKQQETSIATKASLGNALKLRAVNNNKDLELATNLVNALKKDINSSLQNEILTRLTELSGESYAYNIDAKEESVKNWLEWIAGKAQELQEERVAFAKGIENVSSELKELKELKSADDLAKAQLLIKALAYENEDVRKNAISGLVVLNSSETYGYKIDGSADNWQKSSIKWSEWLTQKENVFAQLNNLDTAINSLKESVKSADSALAIKKLVDALSNSAESVRVKAYQALEKYVQKFAQNEVREGFGYDPKAPLDKSTKPLEDWRKWYEGKMQPFVTAEEEKLKEIAEFGQTLQNIKFSSSRGYSSAQELVSLLGSNSQKIREAAFGALLGFSQAKYSYDPSLLPADQSGAIALWNSWLEYNKTTLIQKYYEKYLQTDLSSAQRRTRAFEMISLVKANNTLPELQTVALSWLRQESNIDFSSAEEDKEKTISIIDAWFQTQEPIYRLNTLSDDLSAGINNTLDMANVKSVVAYLDSGQQKVRSKAITILNRLSGTNFAWNATDEEEKRKKDVAEINTWLQEQESLVPIQEKAKAIKDKTSVTREDVKDLVDGLKSSYESVRKVAQEALAPYLPKPLQYQYNAETKKREKALGNIEDWYLELE